ncbi:deneddylase isoform X2 [Tasmannia lanceolata]|uniref:deneddylase isoform X2 n=1 Tax=Tasmannia lanceolata TaxID=3420 RepID=UPI004062AEE2
MASLHSIPSLRLPFYFPKSRPPKNLLFFSKSTSKTNTKSVSFFARNTTEKEILSESDGQSPAVRFYENHLSRLTLIGDVSFEQALTAAAADGGETAEEHIVSGMSTMVLHTVFPGNNSDPHSTISTRLFLPARKVKEKASKLKTSLTADFLATTPSKNILAMTFRQVVLQRLWSFELLIFSPGTERNMENLANPTELQPSFSLSSSDERVLSVLAEAVCSCALESTKMDFLQNVQGGTSSNTFSWFQKPKRISSFDSSVSIYKIPEDEIVDSARDLVVNFNSVEGKYRLRGIKPKDRWWLFSAHSRLDEIGGPELSTWASEYIPAYRLQINTEKFKDVKVQGWQKSADNRWEVLLTHFQMVGLANILDMYYEDIYTIPDKQLSRGLVADFSKVTKNKRDSSSWQMLSITFAGACILVFTSIIAQLYVPHLFKSRKSPSENCSVSLSVDDRCQRQSLEATELEALCISIVKKIKDALGWPGDILIDSDIGAWTGELPSYLRVSGKGLAQEAMACNGEASTTVASGDVPTQDIASYQVVSSRDGKIIGFQPTSRVAVNHWASNPLAKALYEKRKLSPEGWSATELYPSEEVVARLKFYACWA